MVRAALKGIPGEISHKVLSHSGVDDMADGSRDDKNMSGDSDRQPPDEAALSARLSKLDTRLSKLAGERKSQIDKHAADSTNTASRTSAMAVGLRLSSELVAGVVVGTVIGWTFDYLLSTSPWGLIVFMLLGFVAGVMNVMRSAGVNRN